MAKIPEGAAAYSASFLAALLAARSHNPPAVAARRRGADHREVRAAQGRRFGLEITLGVKLPGIEKADAAILMEKARHFCSLCDATRNEVSQFELL